MVNDATSPLLFSTTNVAFASGTESASSALIGPGLAGLIVMIPSIPDSPPEEVCPLQAHTCTKTNPKMIEKDWILTHKFIHHASMSNGSESLNGTDSREGRTVRESAYAPKNAFTFSTTAVRPALDDSVPASKILRSSHA